MRTHAKCRRPMSPQLESLEGKTLLSAGSAMLHVAPRLAAAPIVGQAVSFRGTLAGSDSDVRVAGISHVVSFNTTGTLIGPGSTQLRGTLFARGNPRPGRLLGQLLLRTAAARWRSTSISRPQRGLSPTPWSARGADTIYKGVTGNLEIAMAWTFNDPYYLHQQAWMKFIPR